MNASDLDAKFADVKRRLWSIGLGISAGWGTAACVAMLIACAWIDLVVDLPGGLRAICLSACILLGIITLFRLAMIAARRATPAAVARRVDGLAEAGGQILSGADLRATRQPGITGDLAQLAVEKAASLASVVSPKDAAPIGLLYWPFVVLGLIALVIMIVGAAAPRLVSTQWLRFTDPFGDHPRYSRIQFDVRPGDAKVTYGGALDVRATMTGDVIDSAELVIHSQEGGSGTADESLPMFPEEGGAWRATVSNVTLPARYYVRASGARSGKFDIGVITVPHIESVRFTVTPPAYTNRPPLEGPLPQGGLAGLPGTLVRVRVKSNRPLSGGSIASNVSQSTTQVSGAATAPSGASEFGLSPLTAGANEVAGSFVINRSGKLNLSVRDTNGESSTEPFVAPITVLKDERPFVRMLEPKPDSFATPDATLMVQLMAEDDYGISRLQLFRSLDDTRAEPDDITLPKTAPTRFGVTVPIVLPLYTLVPGETVKLYARVEDNDPAGAKGSESPVVTVRIISQEDMQRMILERQGLEVLLSKYEQAARRMEAAAEKINALKKELDKLDPNSQLAQEMRDKIGELADQLADEAQDLHKLQSKDLPFDLDQALREQLRKSSDQMKATADAAKQLSQNKGLSAGAAFKALDQMAKQLGGNRDEFKQEASDPLDHLSKVFPLVEDEQRFADLYQHQRDLAERMKSLAGHNAQDDPQLKSRMRDLETEQRQVHEELKQLLNDIEDHAAQLPADPKLDKLRETARGFADAVRKSTAADEMAATEAGLSEFAGDHASEGARAAADTLEKFLSKCKGIGEQAEGAVRFQPKLSGKIGNTIQQLLDAEGLGQGKSQGSGSGGYSARRASLRNVGLYGTLPTRSQESAARGGGQANRGVSSNTTGNAGDPAAPNDATNAERLRASGQSDAAVPTQYRRRVGDYFQRVADELDPKRK